MQERWNANWRKKLASCVVLCVLSSCATPHLYPICFYNEKRPVKQEFVDYYLPYLKEALRAAAGLNTSSEIVGTPDGRWLIATVTENENSKAGRLWIRVGCIGNATDSNRVAREIACVNYIENFVTKNQYNQFATYKAAGTIVLGEAVQDTTVLNCQTVATSSDP
jgi:hypothetical protein